MPRHTPLYVPLDRPGRTAQKTGSNGRTFGKPVRILRWIALLAVLGLLLLGIQNAYPALAGSDLFRLAQISVVGNRLLSSQQVVAQSGLEIGGNLFETDLAAATQRLVSHPVIRRAFLLRQPPETLVVSVEERRPIALVPTPGGLWGLDGGGAVFPLPQVPLDLPVITGIQALVSDSGNARRGLAPLVNFVQTLRAHAPTFWEDVSEVHIDSPDDVSVYLVGDGLRLRMRLMDADRQVRNFNAYIAGGAHRAEALAYVDLRFLNQVVVGKNKPF